MSSYPFPWGPPPPGYIPGIGRGAAGFINSLETGKVDFETDTRSIKLLKRIKKEEAKADAFYRSVDEQMKNRGGKKRETEKIIPGPKILFDEISAKFADVKQGLKDVTADEWENLPEIGATTYHRPKWELYTHASDRMIANDFEDSALNRAIRDGEVMNIENESKDSDAKIMSTARAQRSVLNVQLSKIIPQKNTVDVSQYMHELDEQAANVMAQFDDLERAAELYRNMTYANREDPNGWLIRERVEEKRGRLNKARKIARDGMMYCPQSELLVMEAARLSPRHEAIAILQSALQVQHKNSEKIWLQLVAYQPSISGKKTTLEGAINAMPKSEILWKAAAALEDGDKHTSILKRALEFLPESESLWIEGIASANDYDEAQYFVNHAIESLGENSKVLIAWSEADEKFNNSENCSKICQRAFNASPTISISEWVNNAITAEKEAFESTAIGIINSINPLPKDSQLLENANIAQNCGCYKTAYTILRRCALELGEFIPFLDFEKKNGKLDEAINLAIENSPYDEHLALYAADISENNSISILEAAFERLPKSEKIALALIDAYIKEKNLNKAREFSKQIIESIDSISLCLKLAEINEQFGGDIDFLVSSINKYPNIYQFYLLLSDNVDDPKEVLIKGINNCPNSGELHIAFIKYNMTKKSHRARIRALFEKARRLCSDQPLVWLLAAECELPEWRNSIFEEAKTKLEESSDPKTNLGIIWARQIELSEPESRLTLTKEALEQPEIKDSKELLLLLALCYWKRGQIDQTRTIFEKLSREFPKFADGWMYRLKFEKECGSPEDYYKVSLASEQVKFDSGVRWENARNKKEYYNLSQNELLCDLVEFISDPMISDESIFGDAIEI